MTDDALLLVGRDTGNARDVLATHAGRLRDAVDVDEIAVTTVGMEPERHLDDVALDADRVFAVPLWFAHTHRTESAIPAALGRLDATVHYGEPVGRSPSVTEAIADRAADVTNGRAPGSVALVAFGSSSNPDGRLTTEYHATRLRKRAAHDEVVPCYLLQNPAAECVRYNLAAERSVAVPLFLSASDVTRRRIPEALELDRGGLEYAAPLGDHEGVTDAIRTEVERVRSQAERGTEGSADPTVVEAPVPVTDGDGLER